MSDDEPVPKPLTPAQRLAILIQAADEVTAAHHKVMFDEERWSLISNELKRLQGLERSLKCDGGST